MKRTLFKNYPPEIYSSFYYKNNCIVSNAISFTQDLFPGKLEKLISKLMPKNNIIGGIQNFTIEETIEKLKTSDYLTLNDEFIFSASEYCKEGTKKEFTTVDILCFTDWISINDVDNDDKEVIIVNCGISSINGINVTPFCISSLDILGDIKISSGLCLLIKCIAEAKPLPIFIIDDIYILPCKKVPPDLSCTWAAGCIYKRKVTVREAKDLGFTCIKLVK